MVMVELIYSESATVSKLGQNNCTYDLKDVRTFSRTTQSHRW